MSRKIKVEYQSRLPHITPIGANFFVTFRLADALPQKVVQALKLELEKTIQLLKQNKPKNYKQLIQDEKKRFFGKYDYQLDRKSFGSCALGKPKIATIIKQQLHRYDGQLYDLIAYSIMPNHVHILIDTAIQVTEYIEFDGEQMPFLMSDIPNDFEELYKIMKRIKGASGYYANKVLGTKGTPFWQKDSYDHFIRNTQEWNNIVAYILENPVKAGLVKSSQEWKWSYLKPILL